MKTEAKLRDKLDSLKRADMLNLANELRVDHADWLTKGQLIDALEADHSRALLQRFRLTWWSRYGRAMMGSVGFFVSLCAFAIWWLNTQQDGAPQTRFDIMLERELGFSSVAISRFHGRDANTKHLRPSKRARQLAKHIPDDAEPLALALKAFAFDDYDSAWTWAAQAKTDADALRLHQTQLGMALMQLNYEDAAEYAAMALSVNPADPWLMNEYAYCLFRLGRTQEALDTLTAATQSAEPASWAKLNDVVLLDNVAFLHRSWGRYHEAERFYLRAMDELTPSDSSHSTYYLIVLLHLANLYESMGSLAEAGERFSEAATITRRKYSRPSMYERFVAARGLRNAGKIFEATTAYEEGIALLMEDFGPEHPDAMLHLLELGSMQRRVGKFETAEATYESALEIAREKLGTDHARYGPMLGQMGGLLQAMGRYEEAESTLREALEVSRNNRKKSPLEYADALLRYGTISLSQGRFTEGIIAFREAVDVVKEEWGDEHVQAARLAATLAGALHQQGQTAEAVELYQEALAIDSVLLPALDIVQARYERDLGGTFISMGLYAAAEQVLEKSLVTAQASVGDDHPEYASFLNAVGRLERARRAPHRAVVIYEEALDLLGNSLGTTHSNYASCLNNLGLSHMENGALDDAEKILLQALDTIEALHQENHPYRGMVLNNLAQLYIAAERFEDAALAIDSALEIDRASVGDDHHRYAFHLSTKAMLYDALDRDDDAIALHREALITVEATLGADNLDSTVILYPLASLLAKQGMAAESRAMLERAAEIRKAHGPARSMADTNTLHFENVSL